MPKDNRLTAEKLATSLCERAGFKLEDCKEFAEEMLTLLVAGQVVGEVGGSDRTPEGIQRSKLRLRHWYILLVEQLPNIFNEDPIEPIPIEYGNRDNFIWELVRSPWIMGKSTDVLDYIERMLDGKVSGTPYDPDKDRRKDGKLIRKIIEECFITGDSKSLTNEALAERFGISVSTLENKKDAGMAIFGMLMWLYSVRREIEDMDAGIIPRPTKEKWWMKFSIGAV
ncbi:hypothetical protein SAMN04487770_10662 [Butyrivibrio sp. ob235]|uniref:hypothetical protein n=1 Tax=Butyrivibrio sp. ob235 TaxID=1761780 RepID=UPI0008D84C40|nr:hypothetical protein [Butyrivibrio sp. ob235]SEL12533.1 hypothetical protein SAMN04487770_10662 [Butyrivibrio sp. ob235]